MQALGKMEEMVAGMEQWPCWDVHIPREMCSQCSALELPPRFVCPQEQLLALLCLVVLGWALSLVPSLPHDVELCLSARRRRRSLDMRESGQIMELNLSGAHHPQPCRDHCRCQVVLPWYLNLGLDQLGTTSKTIWWTSHFPQGAACSETSLGGCHSMSWVLGDPVTHRGDGTLRHLTNPAKEGFRECEWKEGSCICGVWSNYLYKQQAHQV